MKTYEFSKRKKSGGARIWAVLLGLILLFSSGQAFAQATNSLIIGSIERITLDPPGDVYAGGTLKIGSETVIIPRNLLIDLPANRLTLQQLFEQAPPACQALGETGLAWTDVCLANGRGGFATIHANRRSDTRVIAGDVFVEKGIESITGTVTHIDYADGYFKVNGIPGFPASGTMVRLNDPDSRHSIQQGLGCDATLGPNCSADPRFTLDADNYVVTFSTGYPVCIPSTSARAGALGSSNGAAVDGTGDPLCPATNRSIGPVADSTRFAPIMVGDSITADGNYEEVNGVRFLSVHTMMVNTGLATRSDITQPDYFFMAEAEMDTPGFENQRVRGLYIGFSTFSPGYVNLWSLHYDPVLNEAHEFPLGSSRGCDNAGGIGTCTSQGIGAISGDIFKIRYDVDFVLLQPGGKGTKPELDPCAQLRAGGISVCPQGGTFAEQFGILSPIPHEIIGRSEKKINALIAVGLGTPMPVALDINGNETPWGEYLFPFGAGLGGIAFPEFVEIDLNKVASPFPFEGIPWNLDRRLSPGGCQDGGCEPDPQPLCPFPYSELDPRFQAQTPTGSYSDPAYTSAPLSFAYNRILSFVDGNSDPARFGGNATVLPPLPDAACIGLEPVTVPPVVIVNANTAVFTAATGEWQIAGTFDGLFRNWASVIIHIGPTLNGQVLGTAQVGLDGSWQFLQTNIKVPDLTNTVSLEFPNGISILNVPLTLL
jgi:hypothetical protein